MPDNVIENALSVVLEFEAPKIINFKIIGTRQIHLFSTHSCFGLYFILRRYPYN
jgi:hypothetical protein